MKPASIFRLFSPESDDPELARARFDALARQLPLLYFILIVNTGVTAYAFRNQAPVALTLYAPLLLAAVCAVRFLWWFGNIGRGISNEDAARYLRHVNGLTLTSASFSAAGSSRSTPMRMTRPAVRSFIFSFSA